MQEKPKEFSGLKYFVFSSLSYGLIPFVAIMSGGFNNPLLYMVLFRLRDIVGTGGCFIIRNRKNSFLNKTELKK